MFPKRLLEIIKSGLGLSDLRKQEAAAGVYYPPTTLFLSYARTDDEPFVRQLYKDLTRLGFQVWWDKEAMESRGRTFLQEIRDAIVDVDRLVLVVGPQAVASDYVRQEYERALDFCKPVVPVLRLGDLALIPPELQKFHYIDFRPRRKAGEALAELARVLRTPNDELGKLRGNVPELPAHFLSRPSDLQAVKDVLLADVEKPVTVTAAARRVGLQGMGGVGKSVLAAALARDCQVRTAFPDGVFWLTLGQEPILTTLQSRLAETLGGGRHTFADAQQGRNRLIELLEGRTCLLILDDVWEIKHVAAFDALGPPSRMLITTRNDGLIRGLGAVECRLGVLSDDQALRLLADWVGKALESLPAEARDVARECGNLPLALAMIGAMLRGKPGRWDNVLYKLRNADLAGIQQQFPDYPYPNLLRAIQVSMEALEPTIRARYLDFAVFPEGAPIPEAALQTFWGPEGLSEDKAQDVLDELVDRSLLRRDERGRLSLHSLLFDYVRKQFSADALPVLHARLLDAYAACCPHGWPSGPNDGYFFEHLSFHLIEARRVRGLHALLEDPGWYKAKGALDPSLASFIDDIQAALTLAEKADPPDYPSIAAYSLLWASATARVKTIPLEALEALTRVGKWEQALAYSRSVNPPERRLLGLRLMTEILSEMGEAEACRKVADQALTYAQLLNTDLVSELRAPAPPLEELWLRLEEKERNQEAIRLEELYTAYIEDENVLETIRNLNAEVFFLTPRAHDIHLHEWTLAFKETLSGFLKGVDFPRDEHTAATEKELGTLHIVELLTPSVAAVKIDAELVRGLAAEVLALVDEPERALALASQSARPMNRFPAMAVAAQAFSRAGRLEPVCRLWSMLKNLSNAKYVGAKAERCHLMLRLVSAFLPFGNLNEAKGPMGTALIFATLPGFLDRDASEAPDNIDALARRLRHRELIEGFADTYSRDTMLAKVRAKSHVLEAMIKNFPDYQADQRRIGAQALEAKIRLEVNEASASSWGPTSTWGAFSQEDFEQEQAQVFCLLGANRLLLGDRAGAEVYWQKARSIGERLPNKNFRVQVLAAVAEVYARVGERAPAEEFCRQFLALIDSPPADDYLRDQFLSRWAEEHVKAGQPDQAIELLNEVADPENRFATAATLALALARVGDAARCKQVLGQHSEGVTAGGVGVADARAKMIAALALADEPEQADGVQKDFLSSAQNISGEPGRLEALIAFIQALVREGESARAFTICHETPDVATRGVIFAAFSHAALPLDMDEQVFDAVVDWTMNTLFTEMSSDQYHFPLALLLTEQAIRRSKKDAAIAERAGFQGSLPDALEGAALTALHGLAERDKEVGWLRALNVLRLAAGVNDFPADTVANLLGKSSQELWHWFEARAAGGDAVSVTSTILLGDLRAARQEGSSHAVWSRLTEAQELLFSTGTLPETWERIKAVESIFKE